MQIQTTDSVPHFLDFAWGRCRFTTAEISQAKDEEITRTISVPTTPSRSSTILKSGASTPAKTTKSATASSKMSRRMTRRKSSAQVSGHKKVEKQSGDSTKLITK